MSRKNPTMSRMLDSCTRLAFVIILDFFLLTEKGEEWNQLIGWYISRCMARNPILVNETSCIVWESDHSQGSNKKDWQIKTSCECFIRGVQIQWQFLLKSFIKVNNSENQSIFREHLVWYLFAGHKSLFVNLI